MSKYPGDWELYDMIDDRTELRNLATKNFSKVEELETAYSRWAEERGVLEWPIKPGMETEGKMSYQRRSW